MDIRNREAWEKAFGSDFVNKIVAEGETKTAELESRGIEYKEVSEPVEDEKEIAEEVVEEVVEETVEDTVEDEKAADSEGETQDEQEPAEEVVEEAVEEKETAEEVVEETVEEETKEDNITRDEIRDAIELVLDEIKALRQDMEDSDKAIVETLFPRVKALEQSDEVKIAEKASETPRASLKAMIRESIVGAKEAQIDGRSSLAKDGPTETKAEGVGPRVNGLSLNLWRDE